MFLLKSKTHPDAIMSIKQKLHTVCNKKISTEKYSGKIRVTIDLLSWQKRLRNEWE